MRTSRGNETREDNIRFVREKLDEADAVLIGAGNGLSITEGPHLFADNQAFEDLFGDLKQRYGIRCILQGMGADGLRRKKNGAFGAGWRITTAEATGKRRLWPI